MKRYSIGLVVKFNDVSVPSNWQTCDPEVRPGETVAQHAPGLPSIRLCAAAAARAAPQEFFSFFFFGVALVSVGGLSPRRQAPSLRVVQGLPGPYIIPSLPLAVRQR